MNILRITRLILFLIFAAALSGCGNTSSSDDDFAQTVAANFGRGYSFDEESSTTGVRVRVINENSMHIADLDRLYTWTTEHMLVQPQEGPLVIFENGFTSHDVDHADSRYFLPTETVVADSALKTVPPIGYLPFSDLDTVMCHEFVHHILGKTTGDIDVNHKSPYFFDCHMVYILAPGQHFSSL